MRHWMQISAGRGPAECAWVVPHLLSCLVEEATRRGLKMEMLDAVPGPLPNTLVSALVAVEGPGVSEFLAQASGTVLWIGRSPFRPHQKRKNWFVSVETFSLPRQPRWSDKDLKFETMRASGPGGQHVNKTESAVRVTHLPTGTSATAREERSQSANRKLALARLSEAFNEAARAQAREAERRRWMQHNTLERGNAVRDYEGEEFRLRK